MEETFNNSHGEGEDTISFLDENDVGQPPNKNYEEESFISHELDDNSDFEEAWDDFSSWRGQNSGDELMLVEEVENESDNSSDGQNRKGTEDDDSYKYGSEGYSSAVSENGSSRPHPIKIKSRKEESESDHSDSDDQMVLTPAAQANYHKIAQKMRPLPLPEKPCAPMQELLSARNSMFGSIFSLADGSGSETGSVHMAGGRRSPALGPWEEGNNASRAPSSARWSDGAAPPSCLSTGRGGAGMIGAVAAEAVEEAAPPPRGRQRRGDPRPGHQAALSACARAGSSASGSPLTASWTDEGAGSSGSSSSSRRSAASAPPWSFRALRPPPPRLRPPAPARVTAF